MLEMIPPEFWGVLYDELKNVDWDAINADADAAEYFRRQRLENEYNAAIRRRQMEQNRRANDNDKRREQIRIASQKHRAKSKHPIK